jgi:hypothetical protein
MRGGRTLTDFKAASPYRFAAAACAAVILAAVGGVVYLVMPHKAAAASGGPHTTASPRGTAAAHPPGTAAARFDPPQDFPDGAGIAVGSADAVVGDGLAYSFNGSDTQGGSADGDQMPTVHAIALGSGDDQWQRPLPELTFPLTGPSLPPLAVTAAPGGGQLVYYAGIALVKGTGTQADQLKLEVGALNPQSGVPGWVTQVNLSSDFLDTEESITGDVSAGIIGVDRDHLVVEVNGSDEAPVTFVLSTTSHALSWTASAFQPTGLTGDVVVGMTVADAFSDSGTPEALNARTGEMTWTDSSLDVSTHGVSGTPAVVSPSIATFEFDGTFSDETYLLSTSDGTVLKKLPDAYQCMYDQVSVVACYSSGINGASLIGFDAASLNELWGLPNPAGARIAPDLHAAYKGLLYTEADNGDVILNARTGADLVTDVPIAPDVVVPGYGLVSDNSNGDDTLLAYPATG